MKKTYYHIKHSIMTTLQKIVWLMEGYEKKHFDYLDWLKNETLIMHSDEIEAI